MKPFLFALLLAGSVHAQPSTDKTADYLAGAGMGYARPAELNHFPGPMHVLELGEQLGLSDKQRAATKTLMDEHKRAARALGAELVESERALEALFKKGSVDEATLARAVREVAAIEGEYRLSHLETHRRMRALLSDEQVKKYDALRGYSGSPPAHQHKH